jgi:hypothetical protein
MQRSSCKKSHVRPPHVHGIGRVGGLLTTCTSNTHVVLLVHSPTRFVEHQVWLVCAKFQVVLVRLHTERFCGLWWDKKYRVNLRCYKKNNYCKSYYARSKRDSGARRKSPGIIFGEAPERRRLRVQKGTRVQASLRNSLMFKATRYLYCNMVQASNIRKVEGNEKHDPQHQDKDKGNTCLPCTTESDSDSTWVDIDSLSTY